MCFFPNEFMHKIKSSQLMKPLQDFSTSPNLVAPALKLLVFGEEQLLNRGLGQVLSSSQVPKLAQNSKLLVWKPLFSHKELWTWRRLNNLLLTGPCWRLLGTPKFVGVQITQSWHTETEVVTRNSNSNKGHPCLVIGMLVVKHPILENTKIGVCLHHNRIYGKRGTRISAFLWNSNDFKRIVYFLGVATSQKYDSMFPGRNCTSSWMDKHKM